MVPVIDLTKEYGICLLYTSHYATIKHILQPILENSLVHGVFENENDNSLIHITVGGMVKDENVIFKMCIRDS